MERKSKTTVWVDQQDRDNMAAIRQEYRLASDSAAIRYALQQVARDVWRASLGGAGRDE